MIFVAAYLVTASLATAEAAYSGLSPTQALMLGLVSGALPAAVAAFMNRKKTRIDVASELIKAASGLNEDYRKRDNELERRLADAESKARLALLAETECHHRMAALEARMNTISIVSEHKPDQP